MDLIYLDNAASSWPKPKAVGEAMMNWITESGANPGRGAHRSAVKASRQLFETRKSLAKLLNIKNPNDIFYQLNTTMALNLAIKGFLRQGDHVICTSIEHNSVRRALEYLKQLLNIQITYLKTDPMGNLSLEALKDAFQSNTTLFVCSHSSNLLGSILPLNEIGELTKKHGVKFLVDAAQSAGALPIDVSEMNIDMLAVPGHKGLLGPQGTAALYVNPNIELIPLLHGGTGSQSESIDQPTVRPDRYESGTQNTVGIVGWKEGISYILQETVNTIHNKEWQASQMIMEELIKLKKIKIIGPALGDNKTGIVSFYFQHVDSSEIAFILDQSYNIAVRAGFHCAPLAHQTAGTLETGAVRASVGCYTTTSEIKHFIEAVKEIHNHYV